MKKILFLANLNPNKLGSMEEHALLLSRELGRQGDTCYLGFIAEPVPEIRRQFEESGARIMTVDYDEGPIYRNTVNKVKQALILRRKVLDERIDLVHINFICLTNPLLWGIYLTGVKIVFTDHASGLVLKRGVLKTSFSRVLHFLLSRRVARYIGVTDYVRDRLRDTHHVSPPKAVTLYNGVNTGRFVPGDVQAAREKLGLPCDAKILCDVAMLIPEKGLQHLVEAVAILVHERSVKDLLVIVVGEGYYRGELEKLVQDRKVADQVQFWGRRSDVDTIVTAADVVVVPPVWGESFGLIIAEAMASARPVVATRVGGIPELIEDGVSGLLVAPGNARELADAIGRYLEVPELKERMVEASLANVRRNFNLTLQVEKLVRLYNMTFDEGLREGAG